MQLSFRIVGKIAIFTPMTNLPAVRAALEKLVPFPEPEWTIFRDHLQPAAFKKEEFLCREGQVEQYIYFICEGVARSFFAKDGREYTFDFFFAGDFATAGALPRRPRVTASCKAGRWRQRTGKKRPVSGRGC